MKGDPSWDHRRMITFGGLKFEIKRILFNRNNCDSFHRIIKKILLVKILKNIQKWPAMIAQLSRTGNERTNGRTDLPFFLPFP